MAERNGLASTDTHFSQVSSVSAPMDGERLRELSSPAASMPQDGVGSGQRRDVPSRNTSPLSRLYAEAAREAAQFACVAIVLPHTQRTSINSRGESEDRTQPLTKTRGGGGSGDSGQRSFSALRDSAGPPETSSFFNASLTAEPARAEVAVALTWELESLEEIATPRSIASGPAAGSSASAHASPNLSLSPPSSSSAAPSLQSTPPSSRTEVSTCSTPTEFVIVNAARAQAAHAQLASFSAAVVAHYRLVKLKVAQRIYRIYYDKWRLALQPRTITEALVVRLSRDTQTPALARPRSVSVDADFADINSFHNSRSVSLAGDTPGSRAADAAAAGAVYFPPAPSPSPRSEASERRPSVAAVAAPPSVGHTFAPSPAPAGLEGIAVRTKPSLLVDFGRHSDAPPRKTRPPTSSPAVALPTVVPDPVRIFRL